MHNPSTRIVRWKGYDQPTTAWESGSVPTGWVRKVQSGGRRVEGSGATTEHEEVVTMEMNRVRNPRSGRSLLQDPVRPLPIFSKSDHRASDGTRTYCPFGRNLYNVVRYWIAGVAIEYVLQGRLVPEDGQGYTRQRR